MLDSTFFDRDVGLPHIPMKMYNSRTTQFSGTFHYRYKMVTFSIVDVLTLIRGVGGGAEGMARKHVCTSNHVTAQPRQ